jgi:hypothetical protein
VRCGAIITVAGVSLVQDWMGMERYLTWSVQHWRSAWQTVPLALAILVGVFVVMWQARARGRVEFCPLCGHRTPRPARELAGNLYLLICPRGCQTTNVIVAREIIDLGDSEPPRRRDLGRN